MSSRLIVAPLALLALAGCGEHMGIDITSLTAQRNADDHVTVNAGLQLTVVGDRDQAKKITEVCVTASWTDRADDDGGVSDGGHSDAGVDGGAGDGGSADAGSADGGSADGGSTDAGSALFVATACTTAGWTDREIKVISLRSTDAIPKTPLLVTIKVTGNAPNASLHLLIRDYQNNQIPSP